MGLFAKGAVLATFERAPLLCTICRGSTFEHRRLKLNTGMAELLDLAWANRSADCLICETCGYVHWFLAPDPVVEIWEADHGYPAD